MNELVTLQTLSDMGKRTLQLDKKCLADLGLKMPKCDPKYLSAVYLLAKLNRVSPYFLHLSAARSSPKRLWQSLEGYGYTWDKKRG